MTVPDNLNELILKVWQEVLSLDSVSPDDNFFELGGDSLRAMDLTERLSAEIDAEVPLVLLFRHPTARGLAQAIESSDASDFAV
jgi:nonribosomal peptide synthetase MxcG